MSDKRENSLQTSARWSRNIAISVLVGGAVVNLVGSLVEPFRRKRERFRHNRHRAAVPVDRKTTEANVARLEWLVEDFKERLAAGEDLLDLWLEQQDLKFRDLAESVRTVPDGCPSALSIENLLDKANVPTMDATHYHEIKTWWNQVYSKATALEEKWLCDCDLEEARAKIDEVGSRSATT